MSKVIGRADLTLIDLNDAIISGTPPANPSVGTLWIDESVTPNLLKKWVGSGTGWFVLGEVSTEGTGTIVSDSRETLGNMANDNLLDYEERKVIKDKLTEITGVVTADTSTTIPTTAVLDSSLKGEFYTVRKSALNAGLDATDALYVAVATQYNTLRTYLNAMTPIKPWDIRTATQSSNVTVVKAIFRTNWLNYYTAVNNLAIATAEKLKKNVDEVEIGGANYARNGNFGRVLTEGSWKANYVGQTRQIIDISTETPPFQFAYLVRNTTSANGGIFSPILWSGSEAENLVGKEITISFWMKHQNIVSGKFGELVIAGTSSTGALSYLYPRAGLNNANSTDRSSSTTVLSGTDMVWKKYVVTHKISLPSGAVRIRDIAFKHGVEAGTGEFWTTGIQIEIGNKVTDWKYSDLDLQEKMTEVDFKILPDQIVSTVTSSEPWNAMRTDANNAKTSLADMMSDLKITPVEKSTLKNVWDRIKQEYAQQLQLASTLGISTTTYTSAYNALVTTTPRIELDILANMATTYNLTTTTRDNFKAQMNTYYTQAEAINKLNTEEVNRTATGAKALADDMMSDLKITPIEKAELARTWHQIQAQYAQLNSQAQSLNLNSTLRTAFTASYNALINTTPRIQLDILANMTTTYTLTTTTRDNFKNQINAYVTKAEEISKAITDSIQTFASSVDQKADAITSTVTKLDGRLATAESKITQTAEDITLKVWNNDIKSAVDGITVGGRNLIQNSTFNSGLGLWSFQSGYQTIIPAESDRPNSSILNIKYNHATVASPRYHSNRILVKADGTETLTLSIDVKASDLEKISSVIMTLRRASAQTGGTVSSVTSVTRSNIVNFVPNQWNRVSITYNIPAHAEKYFAIGLYNSSGDIDFLVREIKVEFGSKATDWTPAPEDVDASIGAVDSRLAQAELKITPTAITSSVTSSTSWTTQTGLISTAQGTANTANGTANTANGTANDLKNNIVPALATRVSSAELKITPTAITSSVTSSTAWTAQTGLISTAQGTANTANGTANDLKNNIVPALATRMSSAEQKITAEEITSTVRSSTTYKNDLALKATPADIDSKINTLEIGGRNYYRTITPITNLTNAPILARNPSTALNGFRLTGQSGLIGSVRIGGLITGNGWWTVSFWGMANGASTIAMDVADGAVQNIPFLTTWKKFELSFEVKNHSTIYNFIDIANIGHIHYDFRDFKVEKGNKATDWTPAPEDVDASISTAQGIAQLASDALGDIMSDLKVTPVEKSILKREWDAIKAQYTQMSQQGTALGVSWTSFKTAYDALNGVTPKIEADILVNMTTNYTFTTTTRNTFQTQWNAYLTQAEALRRALTDKIQTNANSAKSTADTAVANAKTANDLVADMSSDMKVTPLEKSSLKTTWDSIKAEYAQLVLTANSLSVSRTALDTAYNAILNTTPRLESEVLASMSTTYTFTSTTNRDNFKSQFNTYFLASEALGKAITEKVQANASLAQATVDTLAKATGNLVNNPAVTGNADGWSSTTLANVDFQGTTTPVLQSVSTGSTQIYGDYFDVDPSKMYEVSLWFKKSQPAPSSANFYFGTNQIDGSGATVGVESISNSSGAINSTNDTNFYFWSAGGTTNGADWTKLTGYILPSGYDALQAKNLSNVSSHARMKPNTKRMRIRYLNWSNTTTVAGTTWVAMPKVVEVPAGFGDKLQVVENSAITANNLIGDLSSDMKVTPLEKSNLKTTWDGIKAEYTQLKANADALSLATATYTSAYNGMVTTAPRIELDVLANMTTTYTFGSTTLRDAFRAQFNTYFVQREALQKAVRDKIQANANAAQTTANGLLPRMATAESSITQQAGLISSKVSSTDYNGNTVMSMLNQTATTIKMKAENIDMEGIVTVADTINIGKSFVDNTQKSIQFRGFTGYTGVRSLSSDHVALHTAFGHAEVLGVVSKVVGSQWIELEGKGDVLTIDGSKNVKFNNKIIAFSDSETLWTGVSLLTDLNSIRPSRTLANCPNGWILVWSRYVNGGSSNSDWNFTIVPKSFASLTNGGSWHVLPATGSGSLSTAPPTSHKYVYATNTDLTGHARNGTGTENGQCLRNVIAY